MKHICFARYQFTTGAKFAIFTFQGCTVHVSGKMEVIRYDQIRLLSFDHDK